MAAVLGDRSIADASRVAEPSGLAAALEGVSAALDRLVDAAGDDDAHAPAGELSAAVVELQALRGCLEAAEAKVLARWDAQRCWRSDGAKTAAAWLAWKEHLPIGEARRRIRHARACRDFPAIGEAWAAGEIDRTHVTTLLSVRTVRTEAAFEIDHEQLLDVARTCRFLQFKRRCDRWEQRVDLDGAEQGAADDRAAREVHLNQSFGGMWFGKITLDPVSGEIVAGTLSTIEQELFDADWAAAKDELGRDPQVSELGRTPAQRRADALVEMATRARTAPADGRRPAPLFTVVVGLEALAGPVVELFNKTVITPGTAAAWLTEADVERIVFDGPSRVVDVGTQRRFFTGALRRAIEVRDRECFHPSCDGAPDRAQIDHIVEASKGGLTTQSNGRLACAFHNRWRNLHSDRPGGEPDDGDREDTAPVTRADEQEPRCGDPPAA